MPVRTTQTADAALSSPHGSKREEHHRLPILTTPSTGCPGGPLLGKEDGTTYDMGWKWEAVSVSPTGSSSIGMTCNALWDPSWCTILGGAMSRFESCSLRQTFQSPTSTLAGYMSCHVAMVVVTVCPGSAVMGSCLRRSASPRLTSIRTPIEGLQPPAA